MDELFFLNLTVQFISLRAIELEYAG